MDNEAENSGLFSRVRDSFKNGTRPGFLGGEGGGEAPSGSKAEKRAEERAAASGAAADSLKNAEGSAAGEISHREDNLEAARADEQDGGGGLWNGNDKISRTAAMARDIKKGNFKGAFKKSGPMIGIFFVIFVVGGMLAGVQTFQPFALIAQFQESFNSMHTSASMRSNRLLRMQLDSGRVKNPVKGTIFGSTFKITKKQKTELAKQGITYDNEYDYNGKKMRVLKYKNGAGQERIVVADADVAKEMRSKGVGAISFDAAYRSDANFAQKYNAGSRTWRGQYANWFGTATNNFIKKNKLTRNLFKDFKQKLSESEDGDGMKIVKELLAKRTDSIQDEDGKIKRSDLNEEKVRQKLDKIKAKVSGFTNLGCAVADTVGMVSMLVYGAEALQIINLTASTFEAVDKTKAGYGDESPINEVASALNEKRTTTNGVISAGEGGNSNNLALKTDYVTSKNKSAMESEGVAGLFGNGYVNPNDASVQSFNFTNSMKSIMGGIGTGMDTFKGCAYAKIIEAVTDIGLTIGEIIACIISIPVGGEGCAVLIGDFIIGAIISASVGAIISALISAIVPVVTQVLTRDLVSDLGGEDLGNALISGGNMYQGSVHRVNGGSLATAKEYTDFAVIQNQVIAENAKYERMELSPFDITSKNTFMGSIMNQMMSFYTSNSLMKTVVSTGSVVSRSIAAMSPSTSAIATNIAKTLPSAEEYEKNCPYLASIGAVGDSFCNPYTITDTSTIDMDPVDVINALYSSGDLSLVTEDGNSLAREDVKGIRYAVADESESNGVKLTAETDEDEKIVNVKVTKDSKLAKYAKYCGTRTSMFGAVDHNIRSELKNGTSVDSGSSLVDGAANGAIGAIPILGPSIDVGDAAIDLLYGGYISGESCVAGNGLRGGGTPAWDEAKIYQRFIEDQSWAESVELIKKSAMAEYLEEDEDYMADDSYEDVLVRFSGLDKETVSDLLDVIAYYNYINAYDATERYAFGAPVVDEDERVLQFESENVMGGEAITLEGIVYADVRNRSFAV